MSAESRRPGALTSESPLRLELGHCCHKELTWECEFEHRSHAGRLREALAPLGYVVGTDHGFVVELSHRDGQCLVVVPRTGRVQLRLPYTTPVDSRRALALQLAEQIGAAVARLPAGLDAI
jgi:hypothetical protein